MKYLSFRILLLCILLPPILYLSSIKGLEVFLQERWSGELQNVLISDSKPFLEGRVSIEEEISKKINAYLLSKNARKWGIIIQIVVRTGTGRWLYPSLGQTDPNMFGSDNYPLEKSTSPSTEMRRVAENNWKILQEGIRAGLTVMIPRETWLANSILSFYIIIFAFLLYWSYRKSAKEAQRIEMRNQLALKQANENFKAAKQRLKDITNREKGYRQEISILRKDLNLASNRVHETEEDALKEMEQLEEKLNDSISLKEELELEVIHLKEELEYLEDAKKAPSRKHQSQVANAMKRFKTLYKNIEIQERAIEGFLKLESDLQLRAEEVIYNMNTDSSKLAVKRKIFSRKGSTPTFECEFGYKGRIYWRAGSGTKTDILVIGTKNSQVKDLAYLQNL